MDLNLQIMGKWTLRMKVNCMLDSYMKTCHYEQILAGYLMFGQNSIFLLTGPNALLYGALTVPE